MAASVAPAPTSGGRLPNRLPVTRSRTAKRAPPANSAHPSTAPTPLGPNERETPKSWTVCTPERNSREGMSGGRLNGVVRHGVVVQTELSRPEAREARVASFHQRIPGPFGDDDALVEHDHVVGLARGGQPMGD